MSQPKNVFVSYSHEDKAHKDRLLTHLKLMQRQGLIAPWDDCQVMPAEEWESAIEKHLRAADLILLLVTADFLASDYCWGKELKHAMQRHDAGQARVIPILVDHCDWKGAPFGKLKGLPKDAKPVTAYDNPAKAWTEVAKALRKAIGERPSGLLEGARAPSGMLLGRSVPETGRPYSSKATIEFTLHTPMEKFNEKEFIAALERITGSDISEVRVISIDPGSTKIIIEGPVNTIQSIIVHLKKSQHTLHEFATATGLIKVRWEIDKKRYELSVSPPESSAGLPAATPQIRYTLIRGTFHVDGYQPDGDSLRFEADSLSDWNSVGNNVAGAAHPRVQLRFQGINTPEVHVGTNHQPLELAYAARDRMLEILNITNVQYGPSGKSVTSANDGKRGTLLVTGLTWRRPICFVFAGNRFNGVSSGGSYSPTVSQLCSSVNAVLLKEGHAYPLYYQGLDAVTRDELTNLVIDAYNGNKGLWPFDRSHNFRARNLTDIEDYYCIFPKIFRRLLPYVKRHGSGAGFVNALENGQAGENDRLELTTNPGVKIRLSDTLQQSRNSNKIKIVYDPEDMIFD